MFLLFKWYVIKSDETNMFWMKSFFCLKYGVKRNWKAADKLLKKENNSVIYFPGKDKSWAE